MALSPQDKAYYEEKLAWKGCIILVVSTVVLGAVAWPILIYLQQMSDTPKSAWTTDLALHASANGAALGMLVSAVMYLTFRILLAQGWLPRRR